MRDLYQEQLERNIVKYSWFKVFTKRVYLPLIAIQLVVVGGVTVGQLAIIAVASLVVQFALQMPTGYIADKWGNKIAIVIGASITAVSPLFYIFMPNFTGGLIAACLFHGGYTFQSGAIEAFMHDTLIALGKEKEYAKVMGKAQSYGLIGNVILITLIPATYVLNKNLPFILGFVSLMIMLWLAATFTYPKNKQTDGKRKNLLTAARNIITAKNIALFVFAGFMAGVTNRSSEYRELLYQDLGVQVALFGLLLAIGSVLGAILGRFIHHLDILKPLTFYLVDLAFIASCLAVVGLTKSPVIAVTGFILFTGYSRVRMIIFQAKLLHDITHTYKATLISALNLFTIVGEIGAITLLARFIGFSGYSTGYLLFSLAVFGIGIVLWFIVYFEAKRLSFIPTKKSA